MACPVTIDGTAVNWPRGAGDTRQIEKALIWHIIHPRRLPKMGIVLFDSGSRNGEPDNPDSLP